MFNKIKGLMTKAKEKVKYTTDIANNATEVGNHTLIIHAHIRSAIKTLKKLNIEEIEILNSPNFNVKKDGKKYFNVAKDFKLYLKHLYDPIELRRYNLDNYILYRDILETLIEAGQKNIEIEYKGKHNFLIQDELESINKMIKKEKQSVEI